MIENNTGAIENFSIATTSQEAQLKELQAAKDYWYEEAKRIEKKYCALKDMIKSVITIVE